jgi:hypothetical protein
MDNATINALIEELEGAGRYALERGASYVVIDAWAMLGLAAALVLIGAVVLAVIGLRPMPPKDTWDYDDARGFRIDAVVVFGLLVAGCTIGAFNCIAPLVEPEGALILRFAE